MDSKQTLENMEQKLLQEQAELRSAIPENLLQLYADLPLRLQIVFFQELEKIITAGAEERIPIAAIAFKKERGINLSDYALGRISGTLPYIVGKLEKVASDFPHEMLRNRIHQILQSIKEGKQQFLEHVVSKWNPEQHSNFFKGYSESLNKTSTCEVDYPGQSMNFKLYFTLFALWPWIKELENITILHELLDQQKLYLGGEQSFRRLCSRLGISLNKRGRPKTKE